MLQTHHYLDRYRKSYRIVSGGITVYTVHTVPDFPYTNTHSTIGREQGWVQIALCCGVYIVKTGCWEALPRRYYGYEYQYLLCVCGGGDFLHSK